MKKISIIFLSAAILMVSLSSCGLFRKGCGCPTWYKAASSTLKK